MHNRAGLATEQRILSAARQLLAEKGLDGLTVKGICDQAGVRAGSFYNLFESKEQVVLSVVGEAIAASDPGLEHERAADLIEAYIRFITEQQQIARVYLMLAVTGGLTDQAIRKRILRHHQRRLDRFEQALLTENADLDPVETNRLAESVIAALEGYALHFSLDPSFDLAGHARRLLAGVPVGKG
jgi:AcrR family transcriptional regulator